MRCFIGIEMPTEVKDTLYEAERKIGNEYAKVKWVAKKNLHLTLKFLGEINEEEVKLVKDALSEVKFRSFKVSLGNIGWFPGKDRINVIWVGLRPEREILRLHGEIELKLGGFFEKDDRFAVHMTLGRVKFVKDKEKFIDKLNSVKLPWIDFMIKDFSLIKSELTKDGPIYSVLEKYNLE